jgi:hypothetical protein
MTLGRQADKKKERCAAPFFVVSKAIHVSRGFTTAKSNMTYASSPAALYRSILRPETQAMTHEKAHPRSDTRGRTPAQP